MQQSRGKVHCSQEIRAECRRHEARSWKYPKIYPPEVSPGLTIQSRSAARRAAQDLVTIMRRRRKMMMMMMIYRGTSWGSPQARVGTCSLFTITTSGESSLGGDSPLERGGGRQRRYRGGEKHRIWFLFHYEVDNMKRDPYFTWVEVGGVERDKEKGWRWRRGGEGGGGGSETI